MDKCLESNRMGASTIRRRKALCVQEILDELAMSDTDDELETIAAIPPEMFDGITDEEDIDDNLLTGEEPLAKDIAGTFEIETIKDRKGLSAFADEAPAIKDNVRKSIRKAFAVYNDEEPSTSSESGHIQKRKKNIPSKTLGAKRRAIFGKNSDRDRYCELNVVGPLPKYKLPSAFSAAQWKKVTEGSELPFDIVNVPEPLKDMQLAIQHKLKDKTASDIFFSLFDDEVCDLIVTESKRYAMQKNDEHFAQTFNTVLLKRFIGILILSGYNKLPQIGCYWSTNPTLGSSIVKQTMPRSMFRKIKQYLHFHDNNNLDRNDKYTKVRALFDVINKKFMQFGVFEEHLSIDEQMLPYFGRHSCKMYLKNKPIKFGYKTWCMAASTGYIFNMMPYGGSSDKYDKNIGLGASVVMDMACKLEHPSRYQLYFDNFFTSHYLMCLLADKRICATGTVRSNRLGQPAPDLKTGKALPKGNYIYTYWLCYYFYIYF